jgi:hypothetical protein
MRVLIGGIVAGLIIDVAQWLLNGVFLGPDWREDMQALGRPIHESAGSMIFYILLGFGYGIMAIWMYAAIRPRFGAGATTALYAGLGVWSLGYFLPLAMWLPMGLFPAYLMAAVMVIGLLEILIATEAGAWMYREEDPLIGTAAQAVKQAA